MRKSASILALGLGLCSLVSACDEDPLVDPAVTVLAPDRRGDPISIPAVGFFQGQVLDVEDDAPLADYGMSLFNLCDHSSLPLVRTDRQGLFRFEKVPVGDYLPVVHKNGMEVFHLERPRWTVIAGETVEVTLRMAPALPTRGTAYFMRGTVWDVENSRPIPGARVEMNAGYLGGFNWSEYSGNATQLEPVTDEDGRFELGPLPWIPSPDLGDQARIVPSYRVTAPGYRSRAYRESSHPTDLLEVSIRLFPGEDDGMIEGVVMDLHGSPLSGIPVAAEWRSAAGVLLREPLHEMATLDDPALVIATEGAVVSDQEGRYRIENLPDGWYVLRAGPYGDDGWIGPTLSGIEVVGVRGTTTADPLLAGPALGLIGPPDGVTLEAPPEIQWEPIAGASSYRVHLQRGADEAAVTYSTTNPYLTIDYESGLFDRTAWIRWTVEALDSSGAQISRADRPRVFSYRMSDSGNSDL